MASADSAKPAVTASRGQTSSRPSTATPRPRTPRERPLRPIPTSATATGNNISAANEGSTLSVSANQQNSAYVRAETVSTGYDFGAGSAVSYGVGNSLFAGNAGTETLIDNTQVNDGGGVDVMASYTGNQGYDASASATAIGNAATGYACAECDGYVGATNRQTNSADVGARSTTSVASARSVNGVATAVGNTASYYVSRPNQ